MSPSPLESFEAIAQEYPGIDQLDPQAFTRFVFTATGDFPEELYDAQLDIMSRGREPWQDEVVSALTSVEEWRRESESSSVTAREEFAEAIGAEIRHGLQEAELIDRVEKVNETTADQVFDDIVTYIDQWGFATTIAYGESPLFPKGREVRVPTAQFIDQKTRQYSAPYGSKIERSTVGDGVHPGLAEELEGFLSGGYRQQELIKLSKRVLAELPPVNSEQLEERRLLFGAKGANLITLDETLKTLYGRLKDGNGEFEWIEIPPYFLVPQTFREVWQRGSQHYRPTLEMLRQKALELVEHDVKGGLVALRSSAVYSEDGDQHTGAGIYASVAVDPTDPGVFHEAFETIYNSMDTESARAYQAAIGVEQEEMGIVIQAYAEDTGFGHTSYGHINSSGANPNIVEVHSSQGVLLFDKAKVLEHFMIRSGLRVEENDLLHSTPDHSKELRFVVTQAMSAVHATLLAEQVFGKPMQVEFADRGRVVQVRPMPANSLKDHKTIEFPDDATELVRSKAIGVGDLVLEELDHHHDNSDKVGFVTFMSEYGFTDDFRNASRGVEALPKEGAVIILNHSSSGHIQTLCQERGLMCFYVGSKSETMEELESYMDELYSQKGYFDPAFDESADEPTPIKLRLVSDGYEGRIYEAEN